MENTVGAILDGKVKSIAKFGAFISLPDSKTGLVHISEVANSFVKDINEHLTEGQEVKVKVIAIDENGRINLSIKQAQEPVARLKNNSAPRTAPQGPRSNAASRRVPNSYATPVPQAAKPSNDLSFEEKLKAFMSESDSKIAGIKQYSDHRTKSRRR